MTTTNDRIRRELGFDLVKAAREAGIPVSEQKPAPQLVTPPQQEKVVTILDNGDFE